MYNFCEENKVTEQIIGCAIEVHRHLGPGLLEALYENALCVEMKKQKMNFERQKTMPVKYKNVDIGEHRLDLLVDNSVVVELKAVDNNNPVFEAQLLSYLKFSGLKVGLLINFNVPILRKGIKRMVL